MSGKRRIAGIEYSLDDINTLECELIENIERLDGDSKDLKRIARIVSNRMSFIRAIIHAERILEADGVEFVRT